MQSYPVAEQPSTFKESVVQLAAEEEDAENEDRHACLEYTCGHDYSPFRCNLCNWCRKFADESLP